MTMRPENITATDLSDQWLSPKEICTQLQIPEQTFYQWRVKHQGPPAYRIGSHLRIRKTDFDRWLACRADTTP